MRFRCSGATRAVEGRRPDGIVDTHLDGAETFAFWATGGFGTGGMNTVVCCALE
jgi:hypothetical protein